MPKNDKKNTKLIAKNSKATVSNTLNEMFFEQKDMTLQAFRMLMFYLAKIDPKKPDRTEISVPLCEYAKMLDVELNEKAIDKSTTMLLGYVVNIETKDDGEFEELSNKVQVFSQSKLKRRKKDGELILTFKCHDELKPHIFNLQSKFTKFEVWNILNLSTFQDMRMYMLLSQYRVAGERTIELEVLKEKLGIAKGAYPEYKIFARAVLKKCQQALKERTDISFAFKAVGRPAHSIYFQIEKNEEYTILKYLDESQESEQPKTLEYEQLEIEDPETLDYMKRQERENICCGFGGREFDEFDEKQLKELRDLAWNMVDDDDVERQEDILHNRPLAHQSVVSKYILQKIHRCNTHSKPVPHRYSFIRKAVAEDWN